MVRFIYSTIEQYTNQSVENYLNQKTAYFSEKLSGRVQAYKHEVKALSTHPALRKGEFLSARNFLFDYLESKVTKYEKFIIGDIHGNFLNTSGGNPAQGMYRTHNDKIPDSPKKKIDNRDYWLKTVGYLRPSNPSTYVSNPMVSYTTNTKQIVVAHPIQNNKNEIIGLIGATLPWELFNGWLKEFEFELKKEMDITTKMVVLSRDGYYWYHWNPNFIVSEIVNKDGEHSTDSEGLKLSKRFNILNDPNESIKFIGKEMIKGHQGNTIQTIDNVPHKWFYNPIHSAEASLGLIFEEASVHDKNRFFLRQILSYLLIIALIILMLVIYLGYKSVQYRR